LGAWIRRQRFDVVNVHARRQAEITARAAAGAGVPFFMTLHGPAPLQRMRPVFERASLVQVMNESNLEYFRKAVRAERLYLARLVVPWERYAGARRGAARSSVDGYKKAGGEEAPQRGFRVVYCSRLSPLKGPLALAFLRAAEELADEISGLEIEVVGGGRLLARLRREARAANTRRGSSWCVVRGPLVHPVEAMAQADVVVGAGYVAVEALACGRLVVGAGFAGWWGLVTPENFCAAVGENFGDNSPSPLASDVESIAAHLRHAYAVRDSSVREGVLALAEREFSLEAAGKRIEEAFLRAAGN
jgi:glycosyltransferase involved in cell wall biosynthesis